MILTSFVMCKTISPRRDIQNIHVNFSVIGLSDGLTVPFALAAGLSSLGESNIVVLGGIAELIAGAISMGIGGFLASQAERDHYRYLRQHTAQRVIKSCAGELEREVLGVLGPVGVDDKTCRAVAQCLRDVEVDSQGNGVLSASGGTDPESVGLKWSQDIGLTAFLLKFGQGLGLLYAFSLFLLKILLTYYLSAEEIPNRRMYISAFTIGMGYFIGGLIPLLPYFFIPRAQVALIYSCIVTGIVLLLFGAIKARVTGASQNSAGYVWGAFSTLMVGGVAAAAAFGIVRVLEAGAH